MINETEPHVSIKIQEEAVCERCEKIIRSKNIGEQFYCNYCHKFLRRRKE